MTQTVTPAEVDLTIYQGASFRQRFVWQEGTPAAAVDLTDYTGSMMIRRKITDADPILTLTTENGGIDVGVAADGEFFLAISATDTAALDIKAGVYDLEWDDGTGFITRLLQGSVTVVPEVTR